MNKKGFTLVELIVVISIMAILGIFVTINFMNSLKSANQKNCEQFVKKAEEAACVAVVTNDDYGSLCSSGCTLTLKKLYEDGYFDETKSDCTKADIDFNNSNEKVEVTYSNGDNGEKICKYQGQH